MKLIAAAMMMTLALPAAAQHQPYAGQQEREIKALTADEVKQYLSGGGMGFAKSAELNRFPGPSHALELADQLGLSPEQRNAIQALMDSHKAQARAIGKRLVDAERSVEQLFRSGNVPQDALAEAVAKAAALQGEYRLSHLETHRRLRPLLSEAQVARYDALRGYAASDKQHTHKH